MSVPKLSFHKSTSRFYVWQDGKRVYLGRGDDPAKPSMEVVAKYREAVRRILGDEPAKPEMVPETLTVAELAAQFLEWPKNEYRMSHQGQTLMYCLKPLVEIAGLTPIQAFGPRKLIEVQGLLAETAGHGGARWTIGQGFQKPGLSDGPSDRKDFDLPTRNLMEARFKKLN